jgi:hypothetical protein
VPLSEDEQRILSEIEEQLYESDPDLAREVSSKTVYTHAFRNLRWAVLLFLVGTALMVALLATSVLLAFGGVVVMFAAALWAVQNGRRLGKAGWDQVTQSMRTGPLREFFGGSGDRMRDRFRRDEP